MSMSHRKCVERKKDRKKPGSLASGLSVIPLVTESFFLSDFRLKMIGLRNVF